MADERRARGPRIGRVAAVALLVLILVVVLRRSVVDVFRVTESSMWPVLQDGRDLVVVTRVGAAPGRWDLVVAEDPAGAGVPVVKRVLSAGGEHLDFRRGDLWVGPDRLRLERARRPPEVAAAMLVPAYSLVRHGLARLQIQGGEARSEEGRLVLSARPGPLEVRLLGSEGGDSVTDDHLRDGRWVAGRTVVPDLRIEAEVAALDVGAIFELAHELAEGAALQVRIEAGLVAVARIEDGRSAHLAAAPAVLPLRLVLETLDGACRVAVGPAAEPPCWVAAAPRDTLALGGTSRVRLRVAGGVAVLAKLDVSRDVSYGWPGDRPVGGAEYVPPGFAFLAGDNPPASEDSRVHGAHRIARLVGRVVLVWPLRRPGTFERGP
jgi:signal peptidase I